MAGAEQFKLIVEIVMALCGIGAMFGIHKKTISDTEKSVASLRSDLDKVRAQAVTADALEAVELRCQREIEHLYENEIRQIRTMQQSQFSELRTEMNGMGDRLRQTVNDSGETLRKDIADRFDILTQLFQHFLHTKK